jgi:hypothetical protein
MTILSPAIKNNTSGTAGISHRILHSLIASLSPERSSPWKTPYSVNPIITKNRIASINTFLYFFTFWRLLGYE